MSVDLHLVGRIARVTARTVTDITRSARDEASDDLGRLVVGFAILGVGLLLCADAIVVVHALVIVGLMALGVSSLQALAFLLGADVLLALMCGLIARSLLRHPILVETRARIEGLERAYALLAS